MIAAAGLFVVAAAWVVMIVILRIRHVRLARPAAVLRPASRIGILLQVVAYAIVVGVRTGSAGPFAGSWRLGVPEAALLAGTLCAAGAAVVVRAQHALGVQWSLTARLVANHSLITTGPYGVVRHPIYAAMILMLTGTGMALTSPSVVAVSLACYVAGTLVRVRAEDALLATAFGAGWEAYRRRVWALIPGVL